MTELVRYEAAERALAAAEAVDEVLEIRSQSVAWEAYARQAKNRDLEIRAARIRFRAEQRLGEMLIAAKEAGQISRGQPKKNSAATEEYSEAAPLRVKLSEVGIDHKLSARAQSIAAMGKEAFEQALERHAEEVRAGVSRVATDLRKIGAEEKGRAHRRDLASALSTAAIETPAGRLYAAIYLDPPWRREGGIGDRAYENHYPTMAWPDILEALRAASKSLLRDAWAFMWIPRAHLLAPVEVERRELQVRATGELVTIEDRIPLAWACQLALGAEAYSTCFVWTKTDVEHPHVSGSGLIARDQDELLLLFKRGRGLPKPEASQKFGSNHRERPREHSRKPEFYRQMIATMVGCDSAGAPLPVLEMFARVDAEHPLPPGWDACGNQAGVAPVELARVVQSIEESVLPQGLPSGGETVTAAAEATSAGASAAAAVTDIPEFLPAAPPAFPPTEYADLKSFECRDDARIPASQLEAIAPEYVRRGLVHSWCGSWRLSPAGLIRLQVIERERGDRDRMFARHLSADELIEWRALAAVAGREVIDHEAASDLIGKGYVDDFAADRGFLGLTASGQKWLGSIEAYVEKTEGVARPDLRPLPIAPKQLGLLEIIEGAQ